MPNRGLTANQWRFLRNWLRARSAELQQRQLGEIGKLVRAHPHEGGAGLRSASDADVQTGLRHAGIEAGGTNSGTRQR